MREQAAAQAAASGSGGGGVHGASAFGEVSASEHEDYEMRTLLRMRQAAQAAQDKQSA